MSPALCADERACLTRTLGVQVAGKVRGADLKVLDDIRSNTDQGPWPSAKARVFAGQKPRPTPACVCRLHLHTAATPATPATPNLHYETPYHLHNVNPLRLPSFVKLIHPSPRALMFRYVLDTWAS